MKLYYEFKANNDCSYFYDSKIDDVIANLKHSLNTSLNLIYLILNGAARVKIELASDEYLENKRITKFKVFSNKKMVLLEFKGGEVTIKYGAEEYIFALDYSFNYDNISYIATLKSYKVYKKDRSFEQTIENHTLTINIAFASSYLSLEIPLDVSGTINDNKFYKLREDCEISDLKKFYFDYFYPYQMSYDKEQKTILSIYAPMGEDVVLKDRLIIQNGNVIYYYLSNILGDFKMSIKKEIDAEPEYFFNMLSKNIDLNEEALKLERKMQKISLTLR